MAANWELAEKIRQLELKIAALQLTPKERAAISGVLAGQNHLVIHEVWSEEWKQNCNTLRGLLERLK